MILAGDIGGTKTNLALFEANSREPAYQQKYSSDDYDGLEAMLLAFLAKRATKVERAAFGVAGPVHAGHVEKINLAWPVDAHSVASTLGLDHVGLINDLEANAWGITVLGPDDVAVLNEGDPYASGNQAVISAGTGLGEAGLYWDGVEYHVFPSEGGHQTSPRETSTRSSSCATSRQSSGTSATNACARAWGWSHLRLPLQPETTPEPQWLREEMAKGDPAAAIGTAALDSRDPVAVEALDTMVAIFGAEAGNLALKFLATGGVWVGGGIAPKNLEKLREGGFMRSSSARAASRRCSNRFPCA